MQQRKENAAHPPGHDGDGSIGFLPAGTLLVIKHAEVGRATDRYPARFNERPAQPFVARGQEPAVMDFASGAVRRRHNAGIPAKLVGIGETLDLIEKNQIGKGSVLATARIAGIQAAKQTSQLIPLCHTLPLSEVKIDIVTLNDHAEVKCTARTVAQTGVEMEALTGVATALLTIYDMCKAIDKEMQLSDIRLVKKTKQEL